MKIVNLTPHALHIRRADGTNIVVEPSGIVPRLAVSRTECAPVACEDGAEITVSRATFGALTGMPMPSRFCLQCGATTARHERINGCIKCASGPITKDDNKHLVPVVFVVSALCAQAPEMAERDDVFAPGEAIRDDSGKIIGSQGLSYITPIAPVRL